MISENRFLEILDKFESCEPIVVLGDIGVDKYTYGAVNRISPEAPVPVLEVKKEWNKLGLAANVSDNLKSLGVTSTICGVMGDDSHGNLLERLLEEESLKTWGLVRCTDRPTTFKERVTTDLQQICRVDYESKEPIGQESIQKVTDRIVDFSENHGAFILEDYGKGLFTKELAQKVISILKNQNKLIAVDPSRTTDPYIYKGVTLIKPNRKEANLIAKQLGYFEDKVESIMELMAEKLEVEKVVVTLGAEGMAILDRANSNEVKVIPTMASEVYDVSGAGDTAISAITTALCCGANLEEACWIGNFASGVVVGKIGTATVDKTELKDFFRRATKKLNS